MEAFSKIDMNGAPSELETAAIQLHEFYLGLQRGGFTAQEALVIVTGIVTAHHQPSSD